ncbi:hypothetical protein GCM10023155_20540 [Bremerella cremea]
MLLPDLTASQEIPDESSLYQIQTKLIQQNADAWRASNFEESQKILKRLRKVTQEKQNERKHLDLPEIDFILQDSEKFASFSDEQKQVAIQFLQEKVRGSEKSDQGRPAEAILHHKRSLELARTLFSDDSYSVLESQIRISATLLSADSQEGYTEAIDTALSVKRLLEARNMQSFYHYRQIMDVITRLYYRQRNYKSAVEFGKQTVSLYETHDATQTRSYALLTGIFVECLNHQGEYQRALEYARQGLNNIPRTHDVFDTNRIRLLLQYIEAKKALEDLEKIDLAFVEILEISDYLSPLGYPSDLRLLYRKQFLAHLKKTGKLDEAKELQAKIDLMELRLPLQKSRFSN